MRILISKLGATGDVVRTTPLLRRFENAEITWLTAEKNRVFLRGICERLRDFSWDERECVVKNEYDLVINLEDTLEVASFLQSIKAKKRFGAYVDGRNRLRYTDDSRFWFDMSLISNYGRGEADRLKLLNRRSYQELVFEGLGLQFMGETYLLPQASETDLAGDIAIAADSGPVWPMKRWAYYEELKRELEGEGLRVHYLPQRASLLEHLGDVCSHKCVVGGDSLPMHLALGTRTPCVTLFTCTSPWEIYGYGLLRKIISPSLSEFFYQREYDPRGAQAITVSEVFRAVMSTLRNSLPQPSALMQSGLCR
jgi:ADP-heptose:LPS heptosyltransferase